MSYFTALKYELKLHLRGLVFWVGLALLLLMVYSEIVADLRSLPIWVHRLQATPDLLSGTIVERIRPFAEHGVPTAYVSALAGTLADRMAIVLAFVAASVAGFSLHREQQAQTQEVVYATATSSLRYLTLKYGAALCILVMMAGIGFCVTLWQLKLTVGQLGGTYTVGMVVRPLIVMLLPTLLYVIALILCLASITGRPTSVLPIYYFYLFTSFKPLGSGTNTTFPLNLWTFIIRWEGHGTRLFQEEYPLLLANRSLYLGLSVVLSLVAVAALQARRRNLQARCA